MKMRPHAAKRLAQVIAAFHAVIAVCGVIAIPLMVFLPEFKRGILYFALLVLAGWILFWDCPLTTWERKLRERFDPATSYHTTFIRHYFGKKLGIPISETTEATVAIAFLVTIFVVSLT